MLHSISSLWTFVCVILLQYLEVWRKVMCMQESEQNSIWTFVIYCTWLNIFRQRIVVKVKKTKTHEHRKYINRITHYKRKERVLCHTWPFTFHIDLSYQPPNDFVASKTSQYEKQMDGRLKWDVLHISLIAAHEWCHVALNGKWTSRNSSGTKDVLS